MPGAGMPSAPAIWVAACGTGEFRLQVATMTVSMSAGCRPASASAFALALAPIETTVSSSPPNRRSAMPTRLRIHSSLVSMISDSSSLVTTRSGRKWPSPVIREPGEPALGVIRARGRAVGRVMPHPRVLGGECGGVVQVGRRLECHGGHSLQVAFDESDQRASRWQFQHAGDARASAGFACTGPTGPAG